MAINGYVAFDLDGTIAVYPSGQGLRVIGEPIAPMIELVKQYLSTGVEVKIFTARVAYDEDGSMTRLVEEWCEKHIGQRLPVTNKKDYSMITCYDDRCTEVITNSGETLRDRFETLQKKYNALLAKENLKKI